MADIKTRYINEILLDRLISIRRKNPSVEKITQQSKNAANWAESLPDF